MLIRIFIFYGVLLDSTKRLDTISLDSIVHFYCEFCGNIAIGCCFGTLVLPNVVLTTTFCAKSCQFIKRRGKRYNIVRFFKSNYTIINETESSDDIALVVLSNNVTRNIAKINIIREHASIGLEAFIPSLRTNVMPDLKSVVLESCINPHNDDYVCTNKQKEETKSCQSLQGVPLILKDEVIGVYGSKLCTNQSIFMSTLPALPWIATELKRISELYKNQTSSVEYLSRNNETTYLRSNISMYARYIIKTNMATQHEISTTSENPTTSEKSTTPEIPTDPKLKTVTIPTTQLSIKTKKMFKQRSSTLPSISTTFNYFYHPTADDYLETEPELEPLRDNNVLIKPIDNNATAVNATDHIVDAMSWFSNIKKTLDKTPAVLVLTTEFTTSRPFKGNDTFLDLT